MTLTFAYTILYVDSVPETITFYEKAFGYIRKFVTPEGDYGELNTGNTTLSFASHALASSHFATQYIPSERAGNLLGFEIAFTTTDVEQALAKAIAAGATALSTLEEKPWGQKVAYIKDINGFIIEICTPMVG